jgi:hypothetical protein
MQLKFRHRTIKQVNNQCGTPCNGSKIQSAAQPDPACGKPVVNCELTEWSAWSLCADPSQKKDEWVFSQQVKTRSIAQYPMNGGKPCSGELKLTRTCPGPDPAPCTLSPWHDWTDCSATCGVGRHTRIRRVLAPSVYPGKPCNDVLKDDQPCTAIGVCPSSDCKMQEWGLWTACGPKVLQRFRTRLIANRTIGNGTPCTGSLRETAACPKIVTPPCTFSDWSTWENCNRPCDGGQQFRSRVVLGDECHWTEAKGVVAGFKETRSCNTQPCNTAKVDCQLSDWSPFSPCSAKCGEGSKRRFRKVAVSAAHGGLGCDGSLEEIAECHSDEACLNADCVWGEWHDWSACTATCGGGNYRRFRMIAQAPRGTGKLCSESNKLELGLCNQQACATACLDGKWGDWQEWTPCSATCGDGFKARKRMVAQQANSCGLPLPKGEFEEYEKCTVPNVPTCTPPVNCELAGWTEWSYCTETCMGIRERSQVIAKYAAGGGNPCANASLRQIQPCNPSPWGKTMPPGCEVDKREPVNCVTSQWTEWGVCSRSCGGGQRSRTREVTTYAKNRGVLCGDQDLETTRGCNALPCEVEECIDCKWDMWSAWSACSRCGGQRYRHRSIIVKPTKC